MNMLKMIKSDLFRRHLHRIKLCKANVTIYGMICRMFLLFVPFSAISGCVNLKAPDKPIVINLNINIKQEVIYKLDSDSKALIEENAEIF